MLSLRRCRELLDSKVEIQDAELCELREQLYVLADVILQEALLSEADTDPEARSGFFHQSLLHLPAEEREDIEERAGIKEFEGGLGRDQAERAALADYLARKGS